MFCINEFCFFWMVFWICTWFNESDVKTAGNITSLVFSTVVTITWPIIFAYCWNPTPLFHLSIGYFIWDLLVCLMFHNVFGYTMIFHAVLSLCSVLLAPYYPKYGFALLTYEFSTVWLNLLKLEWFPQRRWLLTLLFIATFFVFRICFGTYYITMHIMPNTPNSIGVLCVLMVMLNFYWAGQFSRKLVQ